MLKGVPFDWVQRQTAGAISQGLSLDRLLADSMIVPRHGDNRDVIDPVRYLLLCLNTTVGIEDASHGLAKSGLGICYPAIGSRMALSYPNLESALTALCRLYSMASNAVSFQLSTTQAAATLSVSVDSWNDEDSMLIEEIHLSWLFIHCLHFLGRVPSVSEVFVRDPAHFALGRRHWAMGGLVRHGSVSAFHFPRRLLGEPPSSTFGPVVIWDCLKRWLDFMASDEETSAVNQYVTESGFVRFADIVRSSGQSANTVRHHLQAQAGGFRDVRQRTLVDAAIIRLRTSNDSVETIAAELGYSEGRSFRRFLKNATGFTPQQVRVCEPDEVSSVDSVAMTKLKSLVEQLAI